jgi:hypothetical protein
LNHSVVKVASGCAGGLWQLVQLCAALQLPGGAGGGGGWGGSPQVESTGLQGTSAENELQSMRATP